MLLELAKHSSNRHWLLAAAKIVYCVLVTIASIINLFFALVVKHVVCKRKRRSSEVKDNSNRSNDHSIRDVNKLEGILRCAGETIREHHKMIRFVFDTRFGYRFRFRYSCVSCRLMSPHVWTLLYLGDGWHAGILCPIRRSDECLHCDCPACEYPAHRIAL